MGQSPESPWDRLQTVLVDVKDGEAITIDRIVNETDLSPEAVRTVLDGLEKAGLFQRTDDNAFVRRSLFRKFMLSVGVDMLALHVEQAGEVVDRDGAVVGSAQGGEARPIRAGGGEPLEARAPVLPLHDKRVRGVLRLSVAAASPALPPSVHRSFYRRQHRNR